MRSPQCFLSVSRVSTVHFFTLGREQRLVPHSRLHLPSPPLDVNFDEEGRLWVLLDSSDAPLTTCTLRQNSWEVGLPGSNGS